MIPFQSTHSLSWRSCFQRNVTERFPSQEISRLTVGRHCDVSDWWLVYRVIERCPRPIVTHQTAKEFHASISSHHLSNHSQYCVHLPCIYGSQGTRSNLLGKVEKSFTHTQTDKLAQKKQAWKTVCLVYKGQHG